MPIKKMMITKAVEEILKRNPSWAPALINDLTSPNKVARKILNEVAELIGKKPDDIRVDSVAKGVKIYLKKRKRKGVSDLKRVKGTLAESKVSLLTDLSILIIRPKSKLAEKIARVIDTIYKGDQVLYFNQGKLHLTLIFSTEYSKTVEAIFDPKEIVDSYKDNTGILITSPGFSEYDPITFDSYILSLLSAEGIPIVFYTDPYIDTLIIVDSKNAIKTFEIIKSEIERLRKE